MKNNRYNQMGQLLLLLILVGSFGCSSHKEKEAAAPNNFKLSRQMLDSAHYDTARMESVDGVLTLNGKITADENQVIQIYPTLSGYATQINVELGDYVQKGQVLAVIHSGDIANLQNQLSDAHSDQMTANKRLQVERDLYKSQLTTQRDVTDAQSEVDKANAAVGQVESLFRIYKKGKGTTYNIVSPISGYIIQKNLNNGMEINKDDNGSLFTVSEINDVWVIANVFEMQIPYVQLGYDADITSISYPDDVFHGKIDKVYNFLDPQTKTMQVRIKINNNNGLLKPEMFAAVTIHYPGHNSMVAVPSTALIFDNNSNYVLVRDKPEHLIIREVLPGNVVGSTTFIKSGLKPGEVVVSKNQLLLYNALLQ